MSTLESPTPPPAAENTESTKCESLFDRVLKRAGSYFNKGALYLGAVSAFIIAWQHIFGDTALKDATLTQYALQALATVPLLVALLVEWQQWRERRRKNLLIQSQGHASYFRLSPRTAQDHDGFSLPENMHQTVLDWVRAGPYPILHLTGLSGTGKSSLIQAWLKPELEQAGTHRVLLVRAFDDPLKAMRMALLGLWAQPPAKLQKPDLPLSELLGHAVAYLEKKDQRMLIIFDQFEEFFILHSLEEQIQALRDLFHWVLAKKLHSLTLLLSYRKDHTHALAPLQLPPVTTDPNRNIDVNGMSLRPFTLAEAGRFFAASGLALSMDRLDLALREAASYEETRSHIRPIVLNVLGRILFTLAENPEGWRHTRGLIRSQVRQWVLATELREDIRPALEKLLSSSGTVAPCDEQALAAAVGASQATRLPGALNDLQTNGLIRCFSPEEPEAGKRIWQINHDFLARLLALIVEGMRKSFWRRAQPWLAPAALGLWFPLALYFGPWIGEKRQLVAENEAQEYLEQHNAMVIRKYHRVEVDGKDIIATALSDDQSTGEVSVKKVMEDSFAWHRFVDALMKFHCRELWVKNWRETEAPHGLSRLGKLESLGFEDCPQLCALPKLQQPKTLKSLTFKKCFGVQDFEELVKFEELTGLQELSLSHCENLSSLPNFAKLRALELLDLSGCKSLKTAESLKGIQGLVTLRILNLSECDNLSSLPNLKDLKALEALSLRGCKGMMNGKSLPALQGLVRLELLNLSGWHWLEHVPDLTSLPCLKDLNLASCTGLKDADALDGLTALEYLDLSQCTGLDRLPDLSRLKNLKRIKLIGCTGLKGAEAFSGLSGLEALVELDLTFCTGLDEEEFQKVRQMVRKGCVIFAPNEERMQ